MTLVVFALVRAPFGCRLFFFFFLHQDCFRDAARELAECPEVAIIQHDSGKFFFVTFFSCLVRMLKSVG
jgi:hypothetical protein